MNLKYYFDDFSQLERVSKVLTRSEEIHRLNFLHSVAQFYNLVLFKTKIVNSDLVMQGLTQGVLN
jgi:hypothetical protein